MDAATLAAIVSALTALLGGGGGVDAETGVAAPAGAAPNPAAADPGAAFVQPSPGADLGVNPIAPDAGFLDPLAQQFEAVQGLAPVTTPLTAAPPPALPEGGVGPTQAPTPPTPPVQGPPAPAPAAPPPAGIGELLAANPEALMAVAELLGLGQGDQSTVRPAPTAGGSQGSLIPGLQLPQSGQIGALLRQVPGLG